MYCRHCEADRAGGVFCQVCGTPLQELPPEPAASVLQADTHAGFPGVFEETHTRLPATVGAGALASEVGAAGAALSPLNNTTNVTVNVAGPQIVYQDKTGHGIGVRALWFVFFGWWIGQVWLAT